MSNIQIYIVIMCLVFVAEWIKALPAEPPQFFEAAFQGQCDRGSPCEQLCYELHDGMYECDCVEGYELHRNGYSCVELNSTSVLHLETEIDDGQDIIYQKDSSFSAELDISLDTSNDINSIYSNQQPIKADYADITTNGPGLEQKVPRSSSASESTVSLSTSTAAPTIQCSLQCRAGGLCVNDKDQQRCQCLLGKGGTLCDEDLIIHNPRFTGSGWASFPVLQAAYKHVQVNLEIRPETYDGIFFLTGERDDMAGDFMAMLLHQGFVEFRFDCGSGLGIIRSEQTIILNKWNKITLYRHRWDAWIQLNDGKRIQGRSKGLFSRITFREPLFIGGVGNTTRLLDKLPVTEGFHGCIRLLTVNEHVYRFAPPLLEHNGNLSHDSLKPALTPVDVVKGFDVEECTADRCLWAPCQHGGKCLRTESVGDAQCLCPLGFSGDLCETRLDLQVPAFNGSSHLIFPGLEDACSSWLELQLTIKPHTGDGILLYNSQPSKGNDGLGDFIALYLSSGYVGFAFDLGTGTAVVRSEQPITLNEWHMVRLSRSGRLASLRVDDMRPTDVLTPGSSAHLSLTQNLHIGGVPNPISLPHFLSDKGSFVGCVQKVVINDRTINVLAEALGGSNVDNCPHPCITNPCGPDGQCIPVMDYFTCKCNTVSYGSGCQIQVGSANINRNSSLSINSVSGVRFTGTDSYMHYNDGETLHRIVTYVLDINLRFRTTSPNGLMLWSGRHHSSSAKDHIALGLTDGYLQLHYNLGQGDVEIIYNKTRVADGLWHRLRVLRNSQEEFLEVDGGEPVYRKSVGKLFLPNWDSGLYLGGVPDLQQSIGHRYQVGFNGCISELILGGQFEISLKRGLSQNVESCAT
ncbi:pikachurin-like [Ctenocephalides felis]|uniref:pikachurin-like n=1 Tax=Ctenocephalides felis TaxID=7515 RepID=UPI000E6E13E3|nr:pikachurin-like [Ctenocephalides felis]